MAEEKDFDVSNFAFYQTQEENKTNEIISQYPLYSKVEKIFSTIIHIVGMIATLVASVLTIVFSFTSNNSNYQFSAGGYGLFGIVSIVIVTLVACTVIIYSYLYNHKFELKDTELKFKKVKVILGYLIYPALYLLFAAIPLRRNVIYACLNRPAMFVTFLGYALLALVIIASIVSIILNFKFMKSNPSNCTVINASMAATMPWLIVFFYYIVAQNFSATSNGATMLILAAVTMDLGVIFYTLSKSKKGFRTLWQMLAFASYSLDLLAVYYYSMFASIEPGAL